MKQDRPESYRDSQADEVEAVGIDEVEADEAASRRERFSQAVGTVRLSWSS